MSPKNETNFALLVHTCDRYSFLYRGFEAFFNKYWNFSIPCKYYFATEKLETSLKGFETIRSGNGQWSDRLAHLLTHEVKERYVIYFQEDMWLNRPIDPQFFDSLFKLIEARKLKQVKLTSSDVYITRSSDLNLEGLTVAVVDNQRSAYLMSHQVTIWDREHLLQQLHKNEHPWRNERRGTKRLKKLNPEIYQIDYFAENGHPAINDNPDPSLRSGYDTVSENSTLNIRALRYIDELKTMHGQNEYADELTKHYYQQLTHDGNPKPRKEDIFKKLKKWFKGKG